MRQGRLTPGGARGWLAGVLLLAAAGFGRADEAADLRTLLEQQRQELEAQRRQLDTFVGGLDGYGVRTQLQLAF